MLRRHQHARPGRGADARDVPIATLPYRPASDDHPLLLGHGGLLTVDRLGTVPYRPTWELQDELAEQRRGRRIGDRLLLLEHFPVYTIGRGGDEANLLASRERLREIGAELVRIDRGGDITFHGPGQIVAYPIVELSDPLDLRRYVRTLEAAIIDTAAAFGVTASVSIGMPGIWVDGERKLGRDRRAGEARRDDPRPGAQREHRAALVRRDDPVRHPRQGRHLARPRARPPGPDGARSRTSSPDSWPGTSGCAWRMEPSASSVRRGGREQ